MFESITVKQPQTYIHTLHSLAIREADELSFGISYTNTEGTNLIKYKTFYSFSMTFLANTLKNIEKEMKHKTDLCQNPTTLLNKLTTVEKILI